MISPNDLEYIADDIINLYSNLNEKIIKDIARRLINAGTMTESARWQIKIAQESGLVYDEIVKLVSENMEVSENKVREIFEEAAIESLEFDDNIYRKVGFKPIPINQSETMLNILQASLSKTNNSIYNLCMTTASSGQESFINVCDEIYQDVISGAFDYNTAIFNGIEKLSKDGLYVYYPSGYREKIDVAVRKNVVTGIAQTTGQMQIERARELDTDLMELTAHEGARPTHEKWQGKVVSLSGKITKLKNGEKVLSLKDIGYGTITGFKGANCRHDWYPFFDGISERAYTKKELKDLNNQTVRYNNQDIKIYDARQMQRSLERSIREDKRQLAGYSGILTSNTDNEELIEEARSKFAQKSMELKQKENILADFSEQTGLKRDKARERLNRFDKSISQKVVWSNKNILNQIDENIFENIFNKNNKVILKDITSQKNRLIENSFKNENIKNIALKVKLESIKTGGKKSYHLQGNLVLKENYTSRSFIHEMAHNIDYQNNWLSSSKEFIKALEADKTIILKNTDKYAKIIKDNKNCEGLSDIIGGMTANKIVGRYRHKKSYWKKPNKLQREAFAQLFTMAGEDDFEQLELIQKYLQNTFKAFDKLIGGIL